MGQPQKFRPDCMFVTFRALANALGVHPDTSAKWARDLGITTRVGKREIVSVEKLKSSPLSDAYGRLMEDYIEQEAEKASKLTRDQTKTR